MPYEPATEELRAIRREIESLRRDHEREKAAEQHRRAMQSIDITGWAYLGVMFVIFIASMAVLIVVSNCDCDKPEVPSGEAHAPVATLPSE